MSLLQYRVAQHAVLGASAAPVPLMLVWVAESNAGGQVFVSGIPAGDKVVTPEVQILDPINLDGFEDMEIGVNQNRDHSGLSPAQAGWQIQLGNRMRAGTFVPAPVYLVEGGQGGQGLSYFQNGQPSWNKLVARINAGKAAIETATGQEPFVVIWHTHGINDCIAGMSAADYKSGTIDFIQRMRVLVPGAPVIMTEMPAGFHANEAAFNNVQVEIAAEIADTYVTDTTGLTLADQYHWDYDGYAETVNRKITQTLTLV